MSERTPPPRVKVSRVLDRYCTRKGYSYVYTLYIKNDGAVVELEGRGPSKSEKGMRTPKVVSYQSAALLPGS